MCIRNWLIKIILIVFIFKSGPAISQNASDLLLKADNLFVQMNTIEAITNYQKLWNNNKIDSDNRAKAGRMYAKMLWLFYAKNSEAKSVLKKLELDYPGKNLTASLKARVFESEFDYEQAISILKKGINFTTNESDKTDLIIQLNKVIINKYVNLINNGDSILKPKELKESYKSALVIYNKYIGKVENTKTLIGLSLLNDEYITLMRAWLSYYQVGNNLEHPSLLLSNAYSHLNWLIGKSSNNKLSKLEATDLILGLAKSGFIEQAAAAKRLYSNYDIHNSEIDKYMELYNFYHIISDLTTKFYQSQAQGNADKKKYREDLLTEANKLSQKLNWSTSSEDFDFDKFSKKSLLELGMVSRLYDNHVMGLHLGNAIENRTIEVKQYGKLAKLLYVKVDHMVSNGYGTWYWDGKLGHSGWINSGKEVYQVRLPILAEKAFQNVQDSISRSKRLEKINIRKVKDIELARKNPYSYFYSLLLELRFKAIDELYQSLILNGFSGNKLEMMFRKKFNSLMDQGTIQHEGRHAIDHATKKNWPNAKLEFQAKLSEIYFSDNPFFTLGYGGIISPDLGGKSANGKANLMILKKLHQWMEKNKSQIVNFDKNLPLLIQIPLLSEDQLREAFKSMDPIGKTF